MQVNKRKYKGKELESEEFSDGSGLEWTDFGARMYDQQIGRWGVVDPLAGKYIDVSPYAFVKNNPINNIEIDGRYFDEKNEKKAHKLEGTLNKQIAKLEKKIAKMESKKQDVGDRRERVAELKNSKTDIANMRSDKNTEYKYGSVDNKEFKALGLVGPTTASTGTNARGDGVITMFTENNMGNKLHETKHGGQNARNEFNIATGAKYGVADEIAAYRAQYAWSGSLAYQDQPTPDQMRARLLAGQTFETITQVAIDNINQITGNIINTMVDPGFHQIYPPRDAAGNLIIPLNVWNKN